MGQLNSLLTIGRFPYHLDIILALENVSQTLPKERVVVDDQNSNPIHYLFQTVSIGLSGLSRRSIAEGLTICKRATNPNWPLVLPVLPVPSVWSLWEGCLGFRPPDVNGHILATGSRAIRRARHEHRLRLARRAKTWVPVGERDQVTCTFLI